MLLIEVLSLEDWFNAEEEKHGFLKKINALQQVLNSNVQTQKNRNANLQSFNKQKNEAIASLSKVDLSKLSDSQIKFLEVYGVHSYLGEVAAKKLKNTFIEDTHDIAHLLSVTQTYMQAIQNFKSQIHNISKGLDLFKKEVESFKSLEKPRLSIIFRNNTSIKSLGEFENSSKKWKQIMHGLSKGLDIREDDFEVIGARNGSIVIDLYVVAAAMVPIGFILSRSFDIIERFALMTKRVNTIYESDPTDEAFKAVEEEIKNANEKYFRLTKKLSSQKIAEEVLENEEDGAEKNERITFLEGSIKKILNHLKDGGDLDLFIPNQIESSTEKDDEESAITELRENIQNFRQKKEKIGSDEIIKLLEQIDFDEPS